MRVNIHLPDELHGRLRERSAINVSAICRAALERELRVQDAAAKAPAGLGETVARLARTKAGEDAKRYDDGYQVGVDWARSSATWDELVAVAALTDRDVMHYELKDGHSLKDALFAWATSEDFDPDSDWFGSLSEKPFDRGVARGAADVFDKVKDLVEEDRS